MHLLRTIAWAWLATGVLIGGLLVGGTWYAATHDVLGGVAGRAVAQESPAPTPSPLAAPGRGKGKANPAAATANANNARQTIGQVTAVSADPATFTLQTADGADHTFRVLGTTVFSGRT